MKLLTPLVLIVLGISFFFSNDATAQGQTIVSPYNFVYATTESGALAEVQELLGEFNGIVVYSPEELALYQQLFSIDAIWFDASTLDYLDASFMQELYTNGVSITAFNVEPDALEDLLNISFYAGRFALVEDEIVYIAVQQLTLQSSTTPIVDSSSPGGIDQRSANNMVGMLSRPDERRALLMGIPRRIEEVRQIKQDFFKSMQKSVQLD